MSITCFVLQSLRRRECPNIAPCPCTCLSTATSICTRQSHALTCHLSEALGATRVAIEAGLHVYRFLEEHGTSEEYVQIELNRRGAARPGWKAWGAEAEP